VRTYRRRAGFLILLGAAVFVPLGLIDALANEVQEVDLGEVKSFELAALIAGLLARTGTSLLGEVFYSGAVALTLAGHGGGDRPTLLDVARRLAYWRLIAVDLLFSIGTAIGVILLVVPGVVFFTWYALAGPVVELEDAGVRAAFGRSRRLVRGHFWQVLAVLLPIALASEALAAPVVDAAHGTFASAFVGDWVGESLSHIALSPLFAVPTVLITLELSRSQPASVA